MKVGPALNDLCDNDEIEATIRIKDVHTAASMLQEQLGSLNDETVNQYVILSNDNNIETVKLLFFHIREGKTVVYVAKLIPRFKSCTLRC